MKALKAFILLYVMGLIVFYTLAVFGTRAWDISYFAWAKLGDGGVLVWATIYSLVSKECKLAIRWMLMFSILRFAWDIQSFFTGIGVNNNEGVAVLFLLIILIVTIGTFVEFKRGNKLTLT